MKQSNDFAHDMIDLDTHPNRILSIATRDVQCTQNSDGTITLTLHLQGMRHNGTFMPITDGSVAPMTVHFHLAAYGDSILRFSGAFADEKIETDSLMLDSEGSLQGAPDSLTLSEDEAGVYTFLDSKGRTRGLLSTTAHTQRVWSSLQRKADAMVQLTLYPDGDTARGVEVMSYDHFFPGKLESAPLGCIVDDGKVTGTLFSLHAEANEHFCGTGERFGRLDLAGRTITLENTDALGTASRKAYKNVPFYLSSAGYGLLIHSTAHIRLSFADISNRAVQALVNDTRLDLFVIGGGSPEKILHHYRRLTGFSPELPLWSYGMWMSRMTYFTAEEVEGIVDRLRREGYPCDVIHLDSGYFAEDWVCTWEFSPTRFADPEQFIARLREKGIRISLWQTPNIGKENPLYPEAREKGYLPPLHEGEHMRTMSDFSGQDFGGQIDFTYEPAVQWYQNLLRRLLDIGVACIKTDFGEKILLHADFKGMSGERLHNLYSVLYQKAAFEATAAYTDKPFIWGRSTWTGGQRYPLHWGGDTSATWDGMASTLRGGLQFGLSGYTYWSHDIPGFHGLPEFMNTFPPEDLYLRWTQFGVFTSHMRYHGTTAREPWEFPSVASLVRSWLRFRYAIIPYIVQEAKYCTSSGRSLIAPLLLDYPEDPTVWHIDDQYLFGRDLLVAPVMNERGIRDIYLPKGRWVDLISGRHLEGGRWLLGVKCSLGAIPVFVRYGSLIPYYPELVDSTDDMDMDTIRHLSFCDSVSESTSEEVFTSLAASSVGQLCSFSSEDLQIAY